VYHSLSFVGEAFTLHADGVRPSATLSTTNPAWTGEDFTVLCVLHYLHKNKERCLYGMHKRKACKRFKVLTEVNM
jgi:hypothetical protein